MNPAEVKDRYTQLAIKRDPFLRRAREFAQVTIPSILPPEGHTQNNQLIETYQGFGARCTVNLASRLVTAFLPPSEPFFKLEVPPELLGAQTVPQDLEKNLAIAENRITAEIERANWRLQTFLELQNLIIVGNVGEQMLPDNTLKLYRLDQYVVCRDPAGNMKEMIIAEILPKANLQADPQYADLVNVDASKPSANTQDITLYTRTWYDDDRKVWKTYQVINDQVVPGSDGEAPVPRFNALRWVPILGEDYGRSKVEEHYGDFRSLEGLSKSIVEGAAMASRNITLIRPNAAGGINLRRRLDGARNGDSIIANPEDIEMKQFQNVAGMQVAATEKTELRRELGGAFLMNSSAQRDAERVTKYELRVMIEEIEGVLGGVYTALTVPLQRQRLNRLVLQMQSQDKLPAWGNNISPSIKTGLDALGREKDRERIYSVLTALQGLPPEVIQDYPKWSEILKRVFISAGLPEDVRTDDEVQQIQEQRARIEAMAQAQQPVSASPAASAPQP